MVIGSLRWRQRRNEEAITQTYILKADADGKITIPGTRPGQTVSVGITLVEEQEIQGLEAATAPDDEAIVTDRMREKADRCRDEGEG